MRLKRTRADWLWLLAIIAIWLLAVITLVHLLTIGVYATPKRTCAAPDPQAVPIVRLSRGEIRDLAALAWAEARGEDDAYCAMQAVAAVVINRMQTNPRYFGATITQVISRPNAFSPFGRDDPQNRRMLAVDERDGLYASALLAAIAAVSGADPTRGSPGDGATHFFSGKAPDWTRHMVVTARIGHHTFLREHSDQAKHRSAEGRSEDR